MPPPTNVPAIQLQAAVRGHKDRATIKARNSWMEDLSKGGKLTPRALGDANGELGSRPRALMGVDTSSALKDARSRAEKSRASDRAASSSSAAAPAAAKPLSLSEQRRQERMDKGGFKGAPSAEQKKNAEAAKRADHVAHRQLKDFLDKLVITPLVERATKEGEAVLAARQRQREWETRQLPKPVFSASLFLSRPIFMGIPTHGEDMIPLKRMGAKARLRRGPKHPNQIT